MKVLEKVNDVHFVRISIFGLSVIKSFVASSLDFFYFFAQCIFHLIDIRIGSDYKLMQLISISIYKYNLLCGLDVWLGLTFLELVLNLNSIDWDSPSSFHVQVRDL